MRILLCIVLLAAIYGVCSDHNKDDRRRSKWWDDED